MNKKMLLGAATALSMVVGSTAAFAGPSDKVVYGANIGGYNANIPIATNTTVGQAIVNGFNIGPFHVPGTDDIRNALPADQQGSRYEQNSTVAGNTENASPTVSAKFTLSGTVDKDCSYYTGGNSAQTINLGTIGVQTGNNVNNTLAFDQVSPITANINSSTAGCNTQNQITITKTNGVAGLLNTAAISYDQNQFTNAIPYSVTAKWTGVALGAPVAGTPQTLVAAETDSFKAVQVGAWRSELDLAVNAPAPGKGLIAGTYSDTITVELKAL